MTQETQPPHPTDSEPAEVRVAFWNVQNLFDVEASAIATELDYTPAFGWTRSAVDRKVANLAAVINGMFDGMGPDLLGLCEVETEAVAERLLQQIGRPDLRLAHPAIRNTTAMDTCLIYSDRLFECDPDRCRGHLVHHRFETQDIFEAHLKFNVGSTELAVLVNHWPSRRPEQHLTEPYRLNVAGRCSQLVDQLVKLPRRRYLELGDNDVSLFQLNEAWDRNILIMGDFNDDPWDRSVMDVMNAGFSAEHLDDPIRRLADGLPSWRSYNSRRVPLFNPMLSLMTAPDIGSTFRSDCSQPAALSDQFLLSRGLYAGLSGLESKQAAPGVPEVQIFRPEFMQDRQSHPVAFRPDTREGCSDHFPILMTLRATAFGAG